MYNVEKVRYEHFPTYAIPYLEYNDDTNLTDDDKKNIYEWLERENLNHATICGLSNYTYFSKNPQFEGTLEDTNGLKIVADQITFLDKTEK